MVTNDTQKEHRVKVVLSFGLVAVAVLCAGIVVVGERVAPRLEKVLGIEEPPKQKAPVGGISYDTLKNAPLNQMPVNENAAREIKKQTDQVASTPTASRYSLAVFVADDAKSREILQWFASYAPLKQLADSCNYHVYTASNPLYRERYASTVPASQFPAIMFVDQDGGHVYTCGKQTLPYNARELHIAIHASYETQRKIRQQQQEQQTTLEPQVDQDCPDGSCRPVDREPFINPDRDRKPLFPLIKPNESERVQSLLYWMFHPGEAILAMCCVGVFAVIVLVVLLKVLKS